MLVFAEENQRCALWGYRADQAGLDREAYQTDLGEKDYGPWHPTGLSERTFMTQFGLWNQANGGSAVSVVGERSERTASSLDLLPLILESSDFRVHRSGSAQVASSPDGDIYVWGPHEHVVRATVAQLSLAWDDLEA
jgi:hypothetical protein